MTYGVHTWINCIDVYTTPKGEWYPCPNCGMRPKIWTFDNGRATACGCWNNPYDHFQIFAESIASVLKRTGGFIGYDEDDLRVNWNHWCETKEITFKHANERDDGRW